MAVTGTDDDGERPVEPPQGRAAGLPYDWRSPTAERIRARVWNAGDPRLWTPKTFGWGYTLNLYWVVHPVRYVRAHRR
jgi:hypothetical protein